MTDTTVSISSPPGLLNSSYRRLAGAMAVTAVADWLFYDRPLGISLALFLLLLAGLSLLTNPLRASRHHVSVRLALLFAGLLPIVESLDPLSALFGIVATSIVVSTLTNPFMGDLADRAGAVALLLVSGPVRLCRDIATIFRGSFSLNTFTVWIVPVGLGGVFLLLFASANPLIEKWLAALDPRASATTLDISRILFWAAIAAVTWPVVAVSRKQRSKDASRAEEQTLPRPKHAGMLPHEMLGTAAILRSLVLFNLLFAVQTVLDVIYLWGGVALPDGMTYATYAHHGAYPLILTALLAAGFVLVAMNSGGPAERVPIIRTLVFLWVGQNVMLVISSILRLDLYVDLYSLTYWRVAAFIWMMLVAVGLLLIVVQIAQRRSNRWLILANLTTLTLAVYTCTLVNFPAVIADYNVAHSKEISGRGVRLDFHYLVSLGPQALPAVDRYLQHVRSPEAQAPGGCGCWSSQMDRHRERLAGAQSDRLSSWRSWSFRDWRLQRYIDRAPVNLAGLPADK